MEYLTLLLGVTDQPTKIVIVDPLGSYYVEISCVDVGGQADSMWNIISCYKTIAKFYINFQST